MVARVLDLVPDFFYVHDYDMRFWYANQKAATYFKAASKEDLIGRLLLDVDENRAQAENFVRVCREVMDGGVPRLSDRLPFTRPDGTPGFLRQHDIPFDNPRTGKRMLIGLSRDISAEVHLEEERFRAAELERQLHLAHEIQAALRPSSALSAPGLQVAAFSEPAAYAGGDFYDWGVCPDGRFLLGIGDVAGHGVGPALLAAGCRAYVRALVMAMPIEQVFQVLNGLMAYDVQEGRFVTFAMAKVVPETFEIDVTSAGHGPIYILRARGGVDEIIPESPPLGVLPELPSSDAYSSVLKPGDTLVMLSDGVYEAANVDGKQFGLARLRALLESLSGQPADAIVHRVLDAVRGHLAGRLHQDDLTLVVAARR